MSLGTSSKQLRLPPTVLGWFPTGSLKDPSLSCAHGVSSKLRRGDSSDANSDGGGVRRAPGMRVPGK